MQPQTKKRLAKKGWSSEDIKKAEDILKGKKQDKSRTTGHTNRLLFWGMLFVMVIGNALVSFVLIPILLSMTTIVADLFIFLIGFAIGLWFNLLVWDIEYLTKKHHLIAILIIPLLAVLNLYAIVRISNALNDVFGITNIRGDALTISAIYVIAFLLPYLWTVFVKKKIKTY